MDLEIDTNGTWYLMKENFTSFDIDPCYVKIYVSSQQLPLDDDYDINFSELGVSSLVPRFMKKSDFLNKVDRIASVEEVMDEEKRRRKEWEKR